MNVIHRECFGFKIFGVELNAGKGNNIKGQSSQV